MLRWLVYIVSGLLVLLLVCGTTAYLLLGHLNLASLAAHRASAALGRTVTIAELHVTPGRWITVDAVNARLGNVADGSRPAMVELGHLTAEINAMSLLHRPVMIRRLTVNRLSILLERTPDRTPNWKFCAAKPKPQV